MTSVQRTLAVLVLIPLVVLVGCSADDTAEDPSAFLASDDAYLGLERPGLTPEVFGRDLVCTPANLEFGPSFTPDGREFFYTLRQPGRYNQMFYMRYVDGAWTSPALAPFALEYGDFEPVVTPDGTRIYFGSARPLPGTTELNMDPDIWYVNREDTAWGEVQYFADGMFHLTFTSNLTVYYSYWAGGDKPGTIARREVEGRKYGAIQDMGELHEFFYDAHQPAVPLDDSYLLFSSPPRTGSVGGLDLFVSFRLADGSWQEPINLGEPINSVLDESAPAVSPDGKYLFFSRTSGGTGDLYWMSADILDSLRP